MRSTLFKSNHLEKKCEINDYFSLLMLQIRLCCTLPQFVSFFFYSKSDFILSWFCWRSVTHLIFNFRFCSCVGTWQPLVMVAIGGDLIFGFLMVEVSVGSREDGLTMFWYNIEHCKWLADCNCVNTKFYKWW